MTSRRAFRVVTDHERAPLPRPADAGAATEPRASGSDAVHDGVDAFDPPNASDAANRRPKSHSRDAGAARRPPYRSDLFACQRSRYYSKSTLAWSRPRTSHNSDLTQDSFQQLYW